MSNYNIRLFHRLLKRKRYTILKWNEDNIQKVLNDETGKLILVGSNKSKSYLFYYNNHRLHALMKSAIQDTIKHCCQLCKDVTDNHDKLMNGMYEILSEVSLSVNKILESLPNRFYATCEKGKGPHDMNVQITDSWHPDYPKTLPCKLLERPQAICPIVVIDGKCYPNPNRMVFPNYKEFQVPTDPVDYDENGRVYLSRTPKFYMGESTCQ